MPCSRVFTLLGFIRHGSRFSFAFSAGRTLKNGIFDKIYLLHLFMSLTYVGRMLSFAAVLF